MKLEISAEISGRTGKIETRLVGRYSAEELETLDKLLKSAIIKSGETELRKKDNWVKGKKGLFAGSVSNGSGGRVRMTRKEYDRLCSEILTNRPLLKPGEGARHFFGSHVYYFTVIEPGTYNVLVKMKI